VDVCYVTILNVENIDIFGRHGRVIVGINRRNKNSPGRFITAVAGDDLDFTSELY
jgi:hypothetical protein